MTCLLAAWTEVAIRLIGSGHFLVFTVADRVELLARAALGAVAFALAAVTVATLLARFAAPRPGMALAAVVWVWAAAASVDHLARRVLASPFSFEAIAWIGGALVASAIPALPCVRLGHGRLGGWLAGRWVWALVGLVGSAALVLGGRPTPSLEDPTHAPERPGAARSEHPIDPAERVGAARHAEPPTTAPQDPRPNVVLVSIDTARADLLALGRADGALARVERAPARSERDGSADLARLAGASIPPRGGSDIRDPLPPPMPALDAFAAEGTTFLRAIAQENWTLPSHASILTSLYPAVHGVEDLDSRLADSTLTVAEIFAAAGYRTLGLVDGDRQGFVGADRGFDRGFEDYVHFPDGRGLGEATLPGRVWSDLLAFSDRGHSEDLVNSALRWLAAPDPRPAFLFLHVYDVHSAWGARAPLHRWPYVAREEYLAAVGREMPARDRLVRNGASGSGFLRVVNADAEREADTEPGADTEHVAGRGGMAAATSGTTEGAGGAPGHGARGGTESLRPVLAPEDLALLHDLYRSSARYVDGELARLWEQDATIDGRPTLFAVTSDHGEEFLEHGRLGHEQEYDACLRVPLVFSGGGLVPVGGQIDAVVETIDIAPTLLELARLAPPAAFQGRSLVSLLRANAPQHDGSPGAEAGEADPEEEVVADGDDAPEERTAYWGSEVDQIFGRRSRSHSYFVVRRAAREELYDLVRDPGETANLTPDSAAAGLLDSLRLDLGRWRARNQARREGGARLELDAAVRERLRGLGYIE